MTPDDLIPFLPAPWVEWLTTWAPTIIFWLTVTSAVARLCAPLARRLVEWTRSTPARWDDTAASRLLIALEWAGILSEWVLERLPRIVIGRAAKPAAERKRAEPILAPKRSDDDTPVGGGALGLVLAAVAIGAAHLAVGCSSGPQLPVVTVPVSVRCQEYRITGPEQSSADRAQGDVATTESAPGDAGVERVTYTRRATGAVAIVDSDCTMTVSPTASPTTTGVDGENSGDVEGSVNASAAGAP